MQTEGPNWTQGSSMLYGVRPRAHEQITDRNIVKYKIIEYFLADFN